MEKHWVCKVAVSEDRCEGYEDLKQENEQLFQDLEIEKAKVLVLTEVAESRLEELTQLTETAKGKEPLVDRLIKAAEGKPHIAIGVSPIVSYSEDADTFSVREGQAPLELEEELHSRLRGRLKVAGWMSNPKGWLHPTKKVYYSEEQAFKSLEQEMVEFLKGKENLDDQVLPGVKEVDRVKLIDGGWWFSGDTWSKDGGPQNLSTEAALEMLEDALFSKYNWALDRYRNLWGNKDCIDLLTREQLRKRIEGFEAIKIKIDPGEENPNHGEVKQVLAVSPSSGVTSLQAKVKRVDQRLEETITELDRYKGMCRNLESRIDKMEAAQRIKKEITGASPIAHK